MKKTLLFTLNFLVISLVINATVHTVTVADYAFNPSSLNVSVNDTVRFTWVSGEHTTTCDPATQGSGNSLPSGAATWNDSMTVTKPVFDYKITVEGEYNYYCIPHKRGMKGVITASSVLPVTLSSFLVGSGNSDVSLTWKTATEQNTAYFSVRRSSNGSAYTEIARIPAAGNSGSETSYSFTDNKISTNQQYYYYNLAIVDKDGRQMLSDTKLFKNKLSVRKLITSLSPNPVSGNAHLMMTFNADKEGKMDVRVVNAEGRTIISTNMQAYAGVNNGHLHLGNLATGNYSVICNLNGIKETHQIVVR